MKTNHKLEILEHKSDAGIALAIHYLDSKFNLAESGEDDGTVCGSVISSVAWITRTLTYICLYMRTL
jgi:hypothetical protein